MRNLYYRFLAFLQNIGVLPIVVQTRPFSDAEKMMETQLLSAVSRLIRTGTGDLHLQIERESVEAKVRGQALYLPGQASRDGSRAYFAIAPNIIGEYYWADEFFEFTGKTLIRDFQSVSQLKDAVEAWVESFYEAKETADFYTEPQSTM